MFAYTQSDREYIFKHSGGPGTSTKTLKSSHTTRDNKNDVFMISPDSLSAPGGILPEHNQLEAADMRRIENYFYLMCPPVQQVQGPPMNVMQRIAST